MTFLSRKLHLTLALLTLGAMTAKADSYPPRPPMPQPNAYDDFAAAERMMNEDFLGVKVVIRDPDGRTRKDYPLSSKARYVRASAKALKRFRLGLTRAYMHPLSKDNNIISPLLSHSRSLARLLYYEGQVKASRGDWSGAASDGIDAIQLGATLPRGSALNGLWVGTACEGIGRKPAWDAIRHLSAKQARVFAKRLESILSRRTSFEETMIDERRYAEINSPVAQFTSHEKADREKGQGDSIAERLSNDSIYVILIMLQRKDDERTDEFIKLAQRPYVSRPPKRYPKEGDPNYLADSLIPIYYRDWFSERYATAQNGLLEVAFALRAYREERGAYPESLSSLVPGYLSKIPEDPFALSGPLKYRRIGDRYLLYSIGPNGADDGGKPAEYVDKSDPAGYKPRNRYIVTDESEGDVVAGINR